jgi:hypothetical protein
MRFGDASPVMAISFGNIPVEAMRAPQRRRAVFRLAARDRVAARHRSMNPQPGF